MNNKRASFLFSFAFTIALLMALPMAAEAEEFYPSEEIFTLGSTTPYLRSSYSSVTQGRVTPAKNQLPYGLCWDFAATAACESSLIGKGNFTVENTDLSELQLVNFMFGNKVDPLGYCSKDGKEGVPGMDLNGSSSFVAMWALAGWDNGALEEVLPFCEPYISQVRNRTVSDELARNYDVAHLQNIRIIPVGSDNQSRMNLKKAITEYGALSVSYRFDTSNSLSSSCYYYTETTGANHCVALVGWNDSVSKSLFTYTDKNGVTHRPEGDGAWLMKNSWGTEWGTDGDEYPEDSGAEGYFWLSYYDASFNNMEGAYVFDMEPADTYQYNYQYDGTTVAANTYYDNGTSVAATYAVRGLSAKQEELKAVGIGIFSPDVEYSVQIYRNSDPSCPTTGKALLSKPVTGQTDYPGYYTIPLPTDQLPVLSKGEYFSVVITLSSINDDRFSLYCELDSETSVANSAEDLTWKKNPGKNFARLTQITLRIKAYTVDKTNTDEDSEQTLSTPKVTKTENAATGVKVTWGKVAGAEKYRLYYRLSSASKWSKLDTTGTTATVTGLTSGKSYSFTVKAMAGSNVSASAPISTIVYCAMPTISKTENTSTGVKLTWGKVAGATKYRIYYKLSNASKYSTFKDVTSNTATVTGLTAGKSYVFTVKAYNGSTWSANKASSTVVYRPVPTVSKLSNDADGIVVTYSKISGATKYALYYKESNASKWVLISNKLTANNVLVVGLTSGKSYVFTVKAYVGDGWSGNKTSSAIVRVNAVTFSNLTNSASKTMKATWKKDTTLTGYQIQYSLKKDFSDAKTVTVKSNSTVSQTIKSLTKGKTYYVRIRGYKTVSKATTYGAWSAAKTVKITK